MFNTIIRFSVRFRGVVIALACLLAGYGIYTLMHAKEDVFPDFSPPQAVIQTEAPGLTSEQVEVLVTRPVENAMGGVENLVTIRSKSLQGLSMVTLTFQDRADIWRARQMVAERLGTIGTVLPPGVKTPSLLPMTSSTSVTLVAGLTSDRRSLQELRTLADNTIRPHLLQVTGVADVIVFGGDIAQFSIEADASKLVHYGLTLQDLVTAARRATGVRAAGFIENANQRITLDVEGQTVTPDQLAHVILRYQNGVALRLMDVARVTKGAAPAMGAASVNGHPGVSLMVESQYGADIRAVSAGVEQKLRQLQPELTVHQVSLHPDIFRPVTFIDAAMNHMRNALIAGGVLVILVLFGFLLNVRTAIISATAIPLSLLTAVIILTHFNVSLNMMTLGGLAIALGEVVDDAVIDVENIYRRLRQNQQLEKPLPANRVVLRASLEVRGSVVYATLIVVLAFMPVLSLTGIAGRLFAPLGLAYILAILASLLIALTVTPALAFILLTRKPLAAQDPGPVQRLKARYLTCLSWLEPHYRRVILGVGAACVLALASLPFLSGNFIPELQEGHYLVHMALAPGSSLGESMRVGNEVSHALKQISGVRLVAQRAGRASEVVDPTGVNISEFEVDLKPLSPAQTRRTLVEIQQALARFPGLITSVNTFLAERIDESISGVTAPVVINVFGPDLDIIDKKAREISHVLEQVPGAIGVKIEASQYVPQLTVRLNLSSLAQYGFAPLDVLEAIQTAYAGTSVNQIYAEGQIYDVNVALAPGSAATPDAVGAMLLRSPAGITVPLSQLANISQTSGRYQIQHTDGQRLQTVTSGVHGRAISDFVQEAKQRIASNVRLPEGTYIIFAGEDLERANSQQQLLIYSLAALVGTVILLFLALKSTRALLLVLVNLPFALVGGVLTIWASGGILTLGSLVGFVTLSGITLRNSVMLITHYLHLVNQEGMPWCKETAFKGASERVTPIMMTAIVTALGLLPLALTSGSAGNEVEGPMAIAILGGLITSTLLNLLVLPLLAWRIGLFRKETSTRRVNV